jgi:peptidyl-prolyl cis-trans isomerase C/foldase protein PrsA
MRISIFKQYVVRSFGIAAILFSIFSVGIAESGLRALARVGESTINQNDLEREIRGRLEYAPLARKEFSELDSEFVSKTLDRLIERRLLLIYGRETSVISEEKVEKAFAGFINGMGGEAKAQARLKSASVDYESWKENLKDDIRLMLVADVFANKFGNPKKEDVQAFLKENPKSIYDPERVKASLIVIDANNPLFDDEKLSAFVKALKKEPETFSENAKKFSDGASAKTGGNIGFITKGTYDPAVEGVLYKLKVGEVSDPITHLGKKYIFKIEDHKGGKLNEEESSKAGGEALGVQKSREELRKTMEMLRKKMKVEKYR